MRTRLQSRMGMNGQRGTDGRTDQQVYSYARGRGGSSTADRFLLDLEASYADPMFFVNASALRDDGVVALVSEP